MNNETRKLGSTPPHIEVPEDIFQTACGIVMNAKSLKSVSRHTDVVDAIALALAAERGAWKPVPDEFTRELQVDAAMNRQVLAYENGRYYNAWVEFDISEGGWVWMDDADCEPNPSHYRPLPSEPQSHSPSDIELEHKAREAQCP
jgi:hypothetical protein